MKYYLIIIFIIIVCLLYIYDNLKFRLYNINGQLINNENWEYAEQELLIKYLKRTDNVLQLGGNKYLNYIKLLSI